MNMNTKVCSALILFWLHFIRGSVNTTEERFPESRGFLIYRTISVIQKSCNCATRNSCSCCQNVIILYTKAEKNLCVNFTYQSTGLNIDVSLSSEIIRARSVTVYKPLKFCIHVPGCLFSSGCINILELNQFPKSITACLRLDIFSKKRLWEINYDCVSISTELPSNATLAMINTTVTSEVQTKGPEGSLQTPTMTSAVTMTMAMTPESLTPEEEVTTMETLTTNMNVEEITATATNVELLEVIGPRV